MAAATSKKGEVTEVLTEDSLMAKLLVLEETMGKMTELMSNMNSERAAMEQKLMESDSRIKELSASRNYANTAGRLYTPGETPLIVTHGKVQDPNLKKPVTEQMNPETKTVEKI